MAYFFGFFGISFLDTNAMERSPSSFGLSHLDEQLYTSSSASRGQRHGGGASFAESSSAKGGQSRLSRLCKSENRNYLLYCTSRDETRLWGRKRLWGRGRVSSSLIEKLILSLRFLLLPFCCSPVCYSP